MSDDREAIDPASLGRVMSLVLDSADPRKSGDDRDSAAEAAAEISLKAAYVAALGYLRTVMNGIHTQRELGPDATSSLMEQLASMSVGTIGILGEGEE